MPCRSRGARIVGIPHAAIPAAVVLPALPSPREKQLAVRGWPLRCCQRGVALERVCGACRVVCATRSASSCRSASDTRHCRIDINRRCVARNDGQRGVALDRQTGGGLRGRYTRTAHASSRTPATLLWRRGTSGACRAARPERALLESRRTPAKISENPWISIHASCVPTTRTPKAARFGDFPMGFFAGVRRF